MDLRDQVIKIGKFGVGMDLDHYSSAPSSPTSNLDPSSIPMDQSPTPAAVQPEIPGVHTLHLASDPMDWLTTIECSLTGMQAILLCLLYNSENQPSLAPIPAIPALVAGPHRQQNWSSG
jgi:hypothetical protein